MLSDPIEVDRSPSPPKERRRVPARRPRHGRGRRGRHGAAARSDRRGLFERLGVFTFLQAVSALVLLLYGFLRSIEKLLPIGPLKNGALTRPIDNFLLNWFGDVHVLLGDPAQSASVRARLVDAIWDLEAIQRKPITIVAHSGGAIVTYMTLADPMTAELQVDRVVTHGEGANLAWRLDKQRRTNTTQVEVQRGPDRRVRRPLPVHHRPAATRCSGPTCGRPIIRTVGLLTFPRVGLPTVESIGVWNRTVVPRGPRHLLEQR